MRFRGRGVVAGGLVLAVIVGVASGVLVGGHVWGRLAVLSDLEDRTAAGERYTPSTQSFLRGEHCLEGVVAAHVELDGADRGRVRLEHPSVVFDVVGLPLQQLVPRLHYQPSRSPDEFDAFNLMLAEYSRNGLSVPTGRAGDAIAHFETSLTEGRPYRVAADYRFVANKDFRPIRFAVINNCLAPGRWEFSARDRSGEIYHAWLSVPDTRYHELVARTNRLPVEFVRAALKWRTDEVALDLDRLRRDAQDLGSVRAVLHEGSKSGYSSQDSRRKLAAGFALIEHRKGRRRPALLADLTRHPVHLSSFVAPGKYSGRDRRRFDFGFLSRVQGARVWRTAAKTDYDWQPTGVVVRPDCLEIRIDLGPWVLVLGNLPIALLVPQEDFAIWGFGVGVLPSADLAERRKFLIEAGPPPSFAYLCRKVDGGRMVAVNSHDLGLEQVFVRTHSHAGRPWWEITLTSYERIVDIVKYRVDAPAVMAAELKDVAANYAAPIYRTYRDDNLR